MVVYRYVFAALTFSSIAIVDCRNDTNKLISQLTGLKKGTKQPTKRRWWVNEDDELHQSPEGEITELYITVLENKLIKVQESENEIELYVKGYTLWEDSRIKTNFSSVDIQNGRLMLTWDNIKQGKIWMPFPFIRDVSTVKSPIGAGPENLVTTLELLTHNPFHENVTLIKASFQAKITIFCAFNYSSYPMDTQNCEFRFISERSQHLKLLLHNPPEKRHVYQATLDNLGFDITTTFVETKRVDIEEMTEVGFDLKLKRIYRPFLFQYYCPCLAIVSVSSLSFIVPISAIPGRISLVVTNFLALTTIYINQMVILIS